MATKRLTLANPIESRAVDLSKDARCLNGYFETISQGIKDFVMRPGYNAQATTGTTQTGLPARGLFSINGTMYSCYGNNVYTISPSWVCAPFSGPTLAAGGNLYMVATAGYGYIFMQDETYGYVSSDGVTYAKVDNTQVATVTILTGGTGYSSTPTVTIAGPGGGGTTALATATVVSGVITAITITNPGTGYSGNPSVTITDGTGTGATAQSTLSAFPAGPLAGGAVYLDGYVVVATQAGQIYNSDINNPTIWDPFAYVTAEAEPDNIVAICKHFNYIVAFGEWSTEFFYDNGTATGGEGSPFQRNDSARAEIGCANDNSVCEFEQGTIFLGKSRTHGKGVYVLDGLTPVRVSTRYIEKYLNADTNANDAIGMVFKMAGHTFYCLSLYNLNISPAGAAGQDIYNGVTFVYDLEEKAWYVWTYYNGQQNYWQPTYFAEFNGGWYAQLNASNTIVALSQYTNWDNQQAIWYQSVTPNLDWGNTDRKFYNRAEIVGDKVAFGSTLSIRHSDDDYTTWSTYRKVTLLDGRAQIYNMGGARRRAYDMVVAAAAPANATPLRIRFLEMDITGGEDEKQRAQE